MFISAFYITMLDTIATKDVTGSHMSHRTMPAAATRGPTVPPTRAGDGEALQLPI